MIPSIKKNIFSYTNEVKDIFKKIKNKDFRGNSGMAIKNSSYQIAWIFVSKIGSLIFTVILARILMPELFGLYSLALGTILVFTFFSDLGAGQTLTRFVSRALSKNKNPHAKGYAVYLFKIKFLITAGILIVFLLLAKPISIYYQKPIFLILLSGSLYLFSISLASFFQGFFQSLNDFRTPFVREAFFQVIRLVLIPLLVIYLLSKAVSGETILILIFVGFGLIWAVMALLLFFVAKKTPVFLEKESKLTISEKKSVNLFLKSILAFSVFSIIFTYSDMFILGGFVSSEYIGYYQAAIGIIGSLSTLVLFSGSLLPIFSRLKGNALELGFKKALKITILISSILFLISFLSSGFIINILYGEAYAPAIPLFRGLSFLLILWPLTALYNGYFLAKGKPEIIKNLLIFIALFNLGLNFLLVYFLSSYNSSLAVLGLIFGIVFSNLLYLVGCVWKRRTKA